MALRVDVGQVIASDRREFAQLMLEHQKVTKPRLKKLLRLEGISDLNEVGVEQRAELTRSACLLFRDRLHAEAESYDAAYSQFGPFVAEWQPKEWQNADVMARDHPWFANTVRRIIEAQASFQIESAALLLELALIEGNVDEALSRLRESHRLVEVDFVDDVYVLTLRRGLLPAANLETLELKRVVKGG
jgi:hypothetical protein